MAWNKETIREWLKGIDVNNAAHVQAVGRALLWMYARQTSDEQTNKATSHSNGRGFSYSDAAFLSSVAQSFQKYGRLTPKQTGAVAKALCRYAGQLEEFVTEKAQAAAAA